VGTASPAESIVARSDTGARAVPRDEAHYVAEIRADYTPEHRAYWSTNVLLDLVGLLYGIALGLAFLFTRVSARIRDFATARAPNRYGRVLTYFGIYSVLSYVLTFPLVWYQGFLLEHHYHMSNQSFGRWFGDEMKGLGVDLFFFGVIPLVMLAYLAIQKYRHWWLALALASFPLVTIATLIEPVVIDPLFNKFTPLQDQALKQEILALAARAGIPGRNVYQVDKSEQTNAYNAYVNGVGASQRIVLWDTTLEGMRDDEILYVMSHEMGHYRLGHIWKGIGYFSLLSFALFFFTGLIMTRAVRRFGPRWGFTELHDIASLPLFAVALSLVSLVAQPLVNGYSRYVEHQADQFGLEVTHLNDAAARAFIKLSSQNKSNPEPPAALEWYAYTHPAELERVRFALEYHPWLEGKPNRLFEPGEKK
jgi:Zn-dependent protease with chaperone function